MDVFVNDSNFVILVALVTVIVFEKVLDAKRAQNYRQDKQEVIYITAEKNQRVILVVAHIMRFGVVHDMKDRRN